MLDFFCRALEAFLSHYLISQVSIFRYLWQENDALVCIVVAAAIMHHAIGNHEIPGHYHLVVAQYDLVKHGLVDFDVGGFVFYNDKRPATVVGHKAVAPSLDAVLHERHLIGHKSAGIVLGLDEIFHKVLTHPFLGCQPHKLVAQLVVYSCGATWVVLYIELIFRKI